MKALTAVLILSATAFFVAQTLRIVPIEPGNNCYSSASGGISLGPIDTKDVRKDDGCAQFESARMLTELGQPEKALFVACSHEGARLAFGTVQECMRYSGDYSKLAVDKEELERYCYRHSRKILRRLTFQRQRYFEKCMRG